MSTRSSWTPASCAITRLRLNRPRVYASVRATWNRWLAATIPPAPGRFCTTTVGFPGMYRGRWRATIRTNRCYPPPGGLPTKTVTVRPAKGGCPRAPPAPTANTPRPAKLPAAASSSTSPPLHANPRKTFRPSGTNPAPTCSRTPQTGPEGVTPCVARTPAPDKRAVRLSRDEEPAQPKIMPPSTTSCWPVMKSLASEARKMTVPTRSSGV